MLEPCHDECQLPRAQRFLLSLFLKPRAVETITGGYWGEQWHAKLGEDPTEVVSRLALLGHLRAATTSETLMVIHTVDSLKTALRERGLKSSGRKSELVSRLMDADLGHCEMEARGRNSWRARQAELLLLSNTPASGRSRGKRR